MLNVSVQPLLRLLYNRIQKQGIIREGTEHSVGMLGKVELMCQLLQINKRFTFFARCMTSVINNTALEFAALMRYRPHISCNSSEAMD